MKRKIFISLSITSFFSPLLLLTAGCSASTNSETTPSITNDSVDQFDYDHNKKYNFINPLYVNNKIVSVDVANGGPNKTVPGDGITPRAVLLKGRLPNQKYVDLAKKSYALEIYNGAPKTGTTWILDYKLSEDNSYPKTWYFGTNAHVLDDLMIKNNIGKPDNFANWIPEKNGFPAFNTSAINLLNINDPNTTTLYRDSYQPGWNRYRIDLSVPNPISGGPQFWEGYYMENPTVKTIFLGEDFLSTDPKDCLDLKYSTEPKYQRWVNNKEYADFAVLEINFATSQEAQTITNDYANLPQENKFKYRQTDLIQDYIKKEQYVVSFPIYGNDSGTKELYVNKTLESFQSGDKTGGELGTSPFYSTFKSKPAILDGGVGMSYFGTTIESYDNKSATPKPVQNYFNTWGLFYQLNYANLTPGASGSLVMDEDGYSTGILLGSDQNASIGSMQAFYSSGYSYNGYYGKYDLPAYDLIRGGGPTQTKSYYDGLVQIYGKSPTFKTNLFPNGLVSRY
ncbi:MAG: DUF31 family protein [Malacoplasma sp.]